MKDGSRVLVYGLGRSGLAATKLLARQGQSVVAFDNRLSATDKIEVEKLGGEVTRDPLTENVDVCIAAPGVPYNHADLVALRERGLETIGEVEWVYRTLKAPIVGITGTAGKTSVTRLLADVLQGAGLDAVAGGNIDPALAAVAAPGRTLVTELSSFQLERCPTLKPRVAVVLNLGVDHLDRHGSVAAYHEAKRAVTRNQTSADLLVYNADDPLLKEWAARSAARTQGFSLTDTAAAFLKENTLHLHGEKLLETADLALQGRHQWGNALAAALAAHELGVSREGVAAGLKNFRGVPGRYAPAGKIGDVHFVEDSIATRTLAVRAALEATPEPVVWIVGGVDKGADLAELRPLVRQKVKLVVGVGEAGRRFATFFDGVTATAVCAETDGETALRCACSRGLEVLRSNHGGQGTVLLAPLGASFDQFADYRERAAVFRHVVETLRVASPGVAPAETNGLETGAEDTWTYR